MKTERRKKVKRGLTRQSEDKMTECMLDRVYIRIYVSASECMTSCKTCRVGDLCLGTV